MTIQVICFGLGPIGLGIARLALARPGIQIVGAIDVDPQKIGRDLGEILGGTALGVTVSADIATVLGAVKPEVALHATGSSLAQVAPQLQTLANAGVNVVSTCEELAYPWTAQPQLAAELDAAARRAGITLLGTGINPGYAMDALPLVLTAPCATVQAVRVLRVVDAGKRRGPLQHKVGAGLSSAAFQEGVRAGTIRHVGLPESLHMLATSLGWHLDRTDDTIAPVLAEQPITTAFVSIAPGQVAGVQQIASGFIGEREVLRLELRMYVGAPDPQDSVEIDGDPPIRTTIVGGIHGDTATAAIVVNAIPSVIRAGAGLASMAEVPLVHFW
jgi:4-hydroxy-tetrahydrodipicolinate reductase